MKQNQSNNALTLIEDLTNSRRGIAQTLISDEREREYPRVWNEKSA